MRYAIVIERTDSGYSAYVPDLPGCVATAASKAEVRQLIADAVRFHLEGLRQDGHAVPAPTTDIAYIDPDAEAA